MRAQIKDMIFYEDKILCYYHVLLRTPMHTYSVTSSETENILFPLSNPVDYGNWEEEWPDVHVHETHTHGYIHTYNKHMLTA